jgi:hypothetical protein
VSPLPERFANAESDAGRDGQSVQRREGPDARGSAASSGGDATGNGTTFVRESAVDEAVEMTFPASDPPAWMSSGVPRAGAEAADRTEGGT